MKQYEIWWAQLPLPAGRRPVLLLTRTDAYPYLSSVLAAEVTSHIRNVEQEVRLGPREGLTRPSAASFDNIHAVRTTRLERRIGELSPARHREVKRALGFALRWRELMDL